MGRAWGVLSLVALSSSLAWAQQPPPAKPAPAPAKPAPAPAAPAKPAATPAAPAAPTAGPPKPAAELEAYKPFVGTWKCDGHQEASPMGPAEDFKATWTNKWDLGNFWVTITYDEKHKDPKHNFAAKGFFGWAPESKKYIFGGVDSMGGRITLGSTIGWEGDKMTLEGDAHGPPGSMKVRFIFEKKAKEWTFTFAIQDPKGQWTPTATETCKKAGG